VPEAEPQAPLGHLVRLGFALVGAPDVDAIATSLLADLTALPGVRRVGFALSEGGGRRLRFTASDRDGADGVDWCHIDAYDDVPLTTVVRTGESVLGDRETVARRFGEHMARQPEEVRALAVVPVPGVGSPIGGIALYLDEVWSFDEAQRRLLDATARRTAEAVRRVRATSAPRAAEAEDHTEGFESARTTLEDHPSSAGVARRFLGDFLNAHGVADEAARGAQLCLSELVTNAFMHAGGSSELRAVLDGGELTVSVRDGGAAASHSDGMVPNLDGDPLRVHGRGLQLVDALADRWGSERDVVGTTVWFALDVDRERQTTSHTG
jgi:anti-sigma regulatory factor (Ser/Thr protein kinase)